MVKKKLSESSKPAKEPEKPQTMEELLKITGYQPRGFKRGDTVEGKVVSVTPSEVLIDVGFKSLGVVSRREIDLVGDLFPNLKAGDKILVQIISPETEDGQIVLSIRRAGMEKKWQELVEKKEKGEPVEVGGSEFTRGGLLVDWQGLRGFIPTSQLDPSHVGSPQVGKKFKVVVLEVDRSVNRLVFSEKQALLPQKLAEKRVALAKIKIGEVYEGKISGVVPFGIFVSLCPDKIGVDGLEGLVHISEIAWEKVGNPADYFKMGDKVKVLVISIDTVTGKLNLSVKQLTADPWQELIKKYSPEQEIEGRITKSSSFGVFVELEKGIDGLIHISKIPPGVILTPGEKVTCIIEGIDNQKRKIALTPVLKEKPVGYR